MSYQLYHAYGYTKRQRKRIIIFTTAVIITGAMAFFIGSGIEKINRARIERSYQKEIDRLEREVDHLRMITTYGKAFSVEVLS